MASTDRSLSLLKLFTLEQPYWTAEKASVHLDVSISTAYRYLLALDEVGLITVVNPGVYMLGPAIIQLDRQIQLTDPLLNAARDVMNELIVYAPENAVVLLCRSYSDKVLCIHQVAKPGSALPVSYDRGKPMPMLRGATSKVILASLPTRRLKVVHAAHQQEIALVGLGAGWDEFKSAMSAIRKAGYCISHGEIDEGRIGISVAVVNQENFAIGSLSYVVSDSTDQRIITRLISLLQTGVRELESNLRVINSDALSFTSV